MPASLGSGLDDVTIQVGSNRFVGWQNVSISRSCESMPNTWSVTVSAEFLQSPAQMAGTRPGQSCLIYIGSDLVITGWIDRRSIPIDARNRLVTLSGRGITRNLVDCSADLLNDPGLAGGQMHGANTLDLAQQLCKAYGITAISNVTDLGPPIPSFQVPIGETVYQIIESIARYTGYLVYEDTFGRLVLDRVGTSQHASGFQVPGNVEALGAEQSVDQRFSQYVVVWSGVDTTADLGALGNIRASVTDDTLGEHRVRIIVSEQVAPIPGAGQSIGNDAIAVQRANWEKARRIGRSQAASVTCDSWRDSKGTLWTPNWLATLDAPAADISNATWVIGSLTFRKDMTGTHTDLILMPQDAFNPDPNPLNLLDAELATSPQTSQAPAPPNTSTPP
jgi:prophage tail gpP-like protein